MRNKRIIVLMMTAVMAVWPAVLSAANADCQEIPEYEPWLYMQFAAMGSCKDCDSSYSAEDNDRIRREQQAKEMKEYEATKSFRYKGTSFDGDFDLYDGVYLVVISFIGTVAILSLMNDSPKFFEY